MENERVQAFAPRFLPLRVIQFSNGRGHNIQV